MNNELLDIIDEQNNLTGETAPRNRVHSVGLWHRTVHIYLFRRNEKVIEFLVHLRSPEKDRHPNAWDTRFGGHIKSGATIEQGLASELKEEIGLEAKDLAMIDGGWYKHDHFPNREHNKVYYIEYNGATSQLKFNDGEVREVKWMSVADIKIAMTENPEKWAASIKGFTKISDHLLIQQSAR